MEVHNCVAPFTSQGNLHEFDAEKPISWAKLAHFNFFAINFTVWTPWRCSFIYECVIVPWQLQHYLTICRNVEISKNQNLRRKIENLLEYSGIFNFGHGMFEFNELSDRHVLNLPLHYGNKKLNEMLTLHEITPKLQTVCEGTESRCCQRKSNAQLIKVWGKFSWSLLEKRNLGVAKSIIKYHQQSKCVLAIPKQQFC